MILTVSTKAVNHLQRLKFKMFWLFKVFLVSTIFFYHPLLTEGGNVVRRNHSGFSRHTSNKNISLHRQQEVLKIFDLFLLIGQCCSYEIKPTII